MQIRIFEDIINIKIEDLEEKTFQGLKKKIKEKCDKAKNVSDDQISIFGLNKKFSNMEQTLSDANVTDETSFYVVVKGFNKKTENTSTKKTPPVPNSTPSGQAPFNMPNMSGMFNNQGMPQIDPGMMNQMLQDPEIINSAINMMMSNASPEQKAQLKNYAEQIKNNPELLKFVTQNNNFGGMPNMMNNPMAQGMSPNMMNPMQQHYPVYNQNPSNQMGSSENLNNPYMMNSPMGMYPSPYYNPYYMNNYPQYRNKVDNSTPPINGPCSHGFYPPVMKDGKPTNPDAKNVYESQRKMLEDMGFKDDEKNTQALIKASGDINEALEILTKKNK